MSMIHIYYGSSTAADINSRFCTRAYDWVSPAGHASDAEEVIVLEWF